MRENYFSSATLVAYLSKSSSISITYNKDVDGDPISGFGSSGVEIYAPGMRNPYGITLHSNGKLYGTDNGPNGGFGDMVRQFCHAI